MPRAKYIHHGALVSIYCPACKAEHSPRVEEPHAWQFNGDLERPTFKPSLLVTYRHPKGYSNENPAPMGYDGEYVEERCHSYITDGRIQFLGDCTHALAGQTVDLPEVR